MPTRVPLPTLDVGGVSIAYRADGPPDGPVAVLLHALAGSSATWSRLTRCLVAGGHRVIAPDLRGHGRSAWTGDYRLDSIQRDVVGVLDSLDVAEFDLIGHSLGGHVAALLRAGARTASAGSSWRTHHLHAPACFTRRSASSSFLALHRRFRHGSTATWCLRVLTQLCAADPLW